MAVLAGKLYAFAQAGNPRVDELTQQVNRLLDYQSTVSYKGASAAAFRSSYGQDAAIMSGFNKIVSAAGAVIDTLALRLVTLERLLEDFVADGIRAGYFVDNADFRQWHYPQGKEGAEVQYSIRIRDFDKLLARCRADAQKARELAAAELSKLADGLMEGLDYYKNKTGMPGSLDPQGLLRKGQIEWYSPRIEELRNRLNEDRADMKQPDSASVLKDLQAIGGGAEQVGSVISLIPHPAAQKAGEGVSTVGGVLSGVAGVGEIFGK
jgi:hypothetical protein